MASLVTELAWLNCLAFCLFVCLFVCCFIDIMAGLIVLHADSAECMCIRKLERV